MKWFLVFCVPILLSTRCNSKSILDMESELTVIASTAASRFVGAYFAPNIFMGLQRDPEEIEEPTTWPNNEITQSAQRQQTTTFSWLSPEVGPNIIEDPYVELMMRRKSANTQRKARNGRNKKNKYHIPDADSLTNFEKDSPRQRKNWLNDPASLKVLWEEDAAKNRSLGYPIITTTTEEVVTVTDATEATTEIESYQTTTDDKNRAVLEFIEQLKKKYNNTENGTEAVTNKNEPELREESVPRELNNMVDFGVEDNFNKETTTPKMDASHNETMEQVLKYLINTRPIDKPVLRKKKPKTTAPPEEASSPSSPEILEDYEEIPELGEDEGDELNGYTFLELIRNVFSGIFGALSALFNKRKHLKPT